MRGDDPASSRAEALFAAFLSRRERGDGVDFEALCDAHPDLEDELRSLLSLHEEMTSTAESLSEIDIGASSNSDVEISWEALDVHESQPGDVIDRYKLRSVLGEGGFGRVFLAEQEQPFRRQVALKVIKAGMDTKEVISRFEAERQALALMSHTSIAGVFDAGSTHHGRPYFVMEYAPGSPITEYCDQHRLRIKERLELFVRVCEAVQHAHKKAIIHRDIKPSNVLVTLQDGKPVPKIIDFGLAKAMTQSLTERSMVTQQGQAVGTPAYMSPEQWELGGYDIDTATDIYSLGVLLYELLSGELPFDLASFMGKGYTEVQRIFCEEEPPRPSTRLLSVESSEETARRRQTDSRTLTRQLRGDLDWITLKAMEKDRTRRYASAADLASDIERHLNHEPVLAGPPSATYRARKFLMKRRRSVAAVVFVVLSLATFAVVEWYRSEAKKIRRSQELYSQAGSAWSKYRSLKDDLGSLEEEWQAARKSVPAWAPVWERNEELAAWRKLRDARTGVDDLYNQAVLSLHQALDAAPPDSIEVGRNKRLLEDIYKARHDEAREHGAVQVPARFFRRMIEMYGTGTYDMELRGGSHLHLESEPSGAQVYCFRYSPHEARLLPLPFNPIAGREDAANGIAGGPFLEIERVWEPEATSFVAGDRLLTAAGVAVTSRTELVAVLTGLEPDDAVPVEVRRDGETLTLSWVPFPRSRYDAGNKLQFEPGRLVSFFLQCGITFAGYPLDFVEDCLVGETRPGSPVQVNLPRGSYLFVFRKEGYPETRFPVHVPGEGYSRKVRLFEESEMPPGFVYVPAGVYQSGGDKEAEQSLERRIHDVPGFFMGRYEVTVGEWLEFLNDPEVYERIDENGRALPVTEEVKKEIANDSRSTDGKFQLIRQHAGRFLWQKDKDSKTFVSQFKLDPRWPAMGISNYAAVEYAHWRTVKEGGRWVYRLPTDLEWEKAARGVDGRIYVWGNYRVWSFCWSQQGTTTKTAARVGISPLDESVYGVRDLAGSHSEHTSGRPVDGLRFKSYRGGSWNTTDDQYFRVGSRNGMMPYGTKIHFGLRLVVDAPE